MRIGLQTWGSEGDVQPFIALAAGLSKKAGREVTLLVSDTAGRDYSSYANQHNFKLLNIVNPETPSPEQVERAWRELIEVGNPIKQAELVMKHGFDPFAESMLEAAKELCRTSDVVIGHFFVFPLHVAAEKAGIPLAKLNVVHNCLPSAEICPPGLPNLGRWFYPLGWKLVRRMVNKIFLPRINAFRQREGLPLDKDVMTQSWASDILNLVAVSPSICREPVDWGGRHSVCGFINMPSETSAEASSPGLEEFIAEGAPPVYFTFGSMMLHDYKYIEETVGIWNETVRRVGCRAVFQVPWEDLSAFKTDHRVFKIRRSPYKTIFPKCAAVVHHGGAGTTQSSVLAGRPSVVVAHMADQFFWGSELERLGVAGRTRHRKGLKAVSLAKSVNQVLAASDMATKAAILSSSMAHEDGLGQAIKLIEARLCRKAAPA
jgi:sterol 3beta-glucosyltransferase